MRDIWISIAHHPEDGEESFVIERRSDGTVTFTVTAVWRAGAIATRMVPPVARVVQRRTVNRYLAGVATWSADSVDEGRTA